MGPLLSLSEMYQEDGSSLSLGEQLCGRTKSKVFCPFHSLYWADILSQSLSWDKPLHYLHPWRLENLYSLLSTSHSRFHPVPVVCFVHFDYVRDPSVCYLV